jgi:hypothetical protein
VFSRQTSAVGARAYIFGRIIRPTCSQVMTPSSVGIKRGRRPATPAIAAISFV